MGVLRNRCTLVNKALNLSESFSERFSEPNRICLSSLNGPSPLPSLRVALLHDWQGSAKRYGTTAIFVSDDLKVSGGTNVVTMAKDDINSL